MLQSRLCLIASLSMFTSNAFCQASTTVQSQIPSRLDCSALSSDPKRNRAFTAPLSIGVSQGALSAERPLITGTGKEQFDGKVDPLGRIQLTGKYEDRQGWVYKFRGQLEDKKPTVLKGGVDITTGATGHRDCTITFLPTPREIMAAFSY